jgi:thioredoxin 1
MVLEINEENYQKEVMESNIPVIVDFWASWCGPCQMMAPVFEELSEDSEFAGKMKFVKLSTENSPGLAQQNNVSGIPCLIVFKDGKEAHRIVGFSPKDALKDKIREALS